MWRFYSTRLLSAVVAAAIGGALLTRYVSAPAVPAASTAGVEMMSVLRDDHALIADYLKSDTEARKLANASAAREAENMKLAAHIDATPASQRLALAESGPKGAATEKKVAALRAAARLEPVRVASRAIEPGEPMQLLQMTSAGSTPAPADKPPLVRAAVGAVSGKLRQFATSVERVPSWLVSAADWVSDAVPVSRRLQWPSREFRATL